MTIIKLCLWAYLVIMSCFAASTYIFNISTYLDPKESKEISVSWKNRKWLKPFTVLKTKQDDQNPKIIVYKLVYVLVIIYYIIQPFLVTTCVISCVLYALGEKSEVININFFTSLILGIIFLGVLVGIQNSKKKKKQKQEKKDEMNFKI